MFAIRPIWLRTTQRLHAEPSFHDAVPWVWRASNVQGNPLFPSKHTIVPWQQTFHAFVPCFPPWPLRKPHPRHELLFILCFTNVKCLRKPANFCLSWDTKVHASKWSFAACQALKVVISLEFSIKPTCVCGSLHTFLRSLQAKIDNKLNCILLKCVPSPFSSLSTYFSPE